MDVPAALATIYSLVVSGGRDGAQSEGAGSGSYPYMQVYNDSGQLAQASGGDGTLDEMALYLTDGYGSPRRAFDTTTDNIITVDITGRTADGQQLARWAMEAWETVADIDFREVNSGSADITMQDHEPGAFGGQDRFTYDGVILSAIVNVSTNWVRQYGNTIDSFSFSTYVHELGHALGLGHMGPYDGNASYAQNAIFANDSYQLTVMSYFSQVENPTINASYAEPITPMMVDIIAIQSLYGAPGAGSLTLGNTVWGDGADFGNYLDDVFGRTGRDGSPVAMTIYDMDGVDTINLSASAFNNRLNLQAETFSSIEGLTRNLGIARGTLIENAVMGTGNDTVTGNSVANRIEGNRGNDQILGMGATTHCLVAAAVTIFLAVLALTRWMVGRATT